MIEILGPGEDKQPVKEAVRQILTTLMRDERSQLGWISLPNGVEETVTGNGCVVIGRSDDGKPVSFIIGDPDIKGSACYLAGATISSERRKGWYRLVKTALVNHCRECPVCRINKILTSTEDPTVEKISRQLGFTDGKYGLERNR